MAGKEGNVEDRSRREAGRRSGVRADPRAPESWMDRFLLSAEVIENRPARLRTSTKTGSSRLDARGRGNPHWFAKTAKTSCACLSVDALVSNQTNFPSLNRYA